MKKTLAFVLAATMLVLLCACGGSGNTDTTDPAKIKGEVIDAGEVKALLPEGWMNVNEQNYEELKRRNAEYFIDAESKRLGVDLRSHILELVIETPVTIAHYTGAYRGSVYGYMHSMDDHIVARLQMSEKENFIQGLSFAGAHQISGDGMGPAVTNGRKGAKIILDMMEEDERSGK